MKINPSPKIGDPCETCLRKFVIHFRRYDDYVYDGRFGFDWFRDEFFKKLTVYRKNSDVSFGNKEALVSGSIQELKKTYTQGQITTITPFGMEYIPAWLAMYPKTNDKYNLYPSGIQLNLELIPLSPDNALPLESDGTILKFKTSNPNITIEPEEISLDDFAYSNQLSRDKGDYVNYQTESYYTGVHVNIQCLSPIVRHEEIIVYAIKGETTEIVGKLMLYKNSKLLTLKIRMVDVVIDGTKLKRSPDYEDFLKNRSFNQALINAEIVKDVVFDLRKYRKTDVEVNMSLNRISQQNDYAYLQGDTLKFYLKYGNDPQFKKKHYVFLTTAESSALGSSDTDHPVTLYSDATSLFNEVLVHELGHNLSLDHLFENQVIGKGKGFKFLQGLTANFMDYEHSDGVNIYNRTAKNPNSALKYFYKYQWDILRKKLEV